jgi:hypothetical protein
VNLGCCRRFRERQLGIFHHHPPHQRHEQHAEHTADHHQHRRLPVRVRRIECGQAPAIMNAGSVKIAPAATDSPIDPAVRAKFSSRMLPRPSRNTAMLITACGYVARS